LTQAITDAKYYNRNSSVLERNPNAIFDNYPAGSTSLRQKIYASSIF